MKNDNIGTHIMASAIIMFSFVVMTWVVIQAAPWKPVMIIASW